VPDPPEASHRLAGQRPYVEPFSGPTGTGEPSVEGRQPQRRRHEPGLPGWLAVLVLIGIAGAGGLIDSISGSAIRGAFNYSLGLASLIAILLVRRSQMFSVVIAPPLVYFAASAGLLYVRTGGLHNRGKLIDAATNWIVYGFPAIAGATAVVLVVAGIRLMARR
jgi:Gpi18-like mannosyltransferase